MSAPFVLGLSQVTVTSKRASTSTARQLAGEAHFGREELPAGVRPELAPVSTGLGEIYQFTVEAILLRGSTR
jgi:cobalt-zinc-cadmium resistance protein CzcA